MADPADEIRRTLERIADNAVVRGVQAHEITCLKERQAEERAALKTLRRIETKVDTLQGKVEGYWGNLTPAQKGGVGASLVGNVVLGFFALWGAGVF